MYFIKHSNIFMASRPELKDPNKVAVSWKGISLSQPAWLFLACIDKLPLFLLALSSGQAVALDVVS